MMKKISGEEPYGQLNSKLKSQIFSNEDFLSDAKVLTKSSL